MSDHPLWQDTVNITKYAIEDPTRFVFIPYYRKIWGDKYPDIVGMSMPMWPSVNVMSAKAAEDVFITQNKYNTKEPSSSRNYNILIPKSIVFQDTFDKDYIAKRKSLSSAFFKQKLVYMTSLFKENIFEELRSWQELKGQEFNLIDIVTRLYARIIISCAFGSGKHSVMVKREMPDGTTKDLVIYEALAELIDETVMRSFMPFQLLFPELTWWTITPHDRKYGRNIQNVRDAFQSFIDERREQTRKDPEKFKKVDDLLQILITDENYLNDDNKIITEMTTFFFAGMKTVMTSTTNLIIYMTRDEKLKNRLIQANQQIFDNMNDIEKELTMEISEEFNVSRNYFYESLRIEPPVPITSSNCMSNDCKIGGVNVRKGDILQIFIYFIHHHPDEWHEPSKFIPDRFDSNSEYFKRPDGKPRHPLSFCPFTGGKRICIGKTFAEVLTRYTIPLIYHYYDFEYADPTELQKDKRPFDLASNVMPKFMMKINQKRDIPAANNTN